MVNDFLHYLKFNKQYAAHTIASYERDLYQYIEFLKCTFDQASILASNKNTIRSYIAHLRSKGLQTSSIKRKLSALNSFFKYAIKHGQLERNPMQALPQQKLHRNLPQYINPGTIDNSIEAIVQEEEEHSPYQMLLNQLILEILYQCGLRRAELINLQLTDIDFQRFEMHTLGKGNKWRIVPLSNHLISLLQSYISIRPPSHNQNLLVLPTGQLLYPMYVYRVCKTFIQTITTLQKASPHVLRHTFATELLNNGAHIQVIKTLLGHSSLSATQIYTHLGINKLKEIHAKHLPR